MDVVDYHIDADASHTSLSSGAVAVAEQPVRITADMFFRVE